MRKRSAVGVVPCIILTSIFIFFIACKKQKENSLSQQDPVHRFFSVHISDDPLVESIRNNIMRQDQKRRLVQKLVGKAGFPAWDKAIIGIKQGESTRFVYIPFVMDNGIQTNAILMVKINGSDTLFHMLYGAQYRDRPFSDVPHHAWNAREVFGAFLLFDQAIFGADRFLVSDPRLTGDTAGSPPRVIKIGNTRGSLTGRLNTAYLVTVTTSVAVCHECGYYVRGHDIFNDCCNVTYYDLPVSFWFDDTDNTWTWYSPDLGLGGAGGSADDQAPCGGCNWEDTNFCALDGSGHALGFCDEFWHPYPTVPAYNPLNHSDITVSSGLESKFPCVASFIKDSLSNANFLAQIAGADIFKDSAYLTLTFDTSSRYKTDTSKYTAATSVLSSPFIGTDGITRGQLEIELNPWFLRNGTREFMVANIIHEIFHALFAVRWAQYQNWLTYHDTQYDSNFLKTRYPAFWYAIKNLPRSPVLTPEQDHEIMATAYLAQFSNIMNHFYNPNAPVATRDSVVKAMGYHGLASTTAWTSLPGQGIDTCKYKAIQIAAERASTNRAPTDCPSGYHYNYATDLKLREHCQ